MRVAFVAAETVHHGAGGAAERLDRLAGLLAGRGHEVVVLCTQWWDGEPDEFEREGVDYVAVAREPNWRFARRLPGEVRAADPDVVHAVGDPPAHALAARLGCALASAPLVLEVYDPPAGGPRSDRLYRWAVRSASATVVPSRTVRTGLREAGVPGDAAVDVVADPVEMDLIRETDPAPDGADIVYSRRLDGDANLETLLLALAEFREYDWSAAVLGDGPEREGYERQARDLRIADRVDFVGERDVAERVAYFKAAHVYVQTALRASFATDLLRALACGCVGIVEYHVDSSAHELVERDPRGFRATNDEEVTERLIEAADLERRAVDERYAEYDETEFLERHLERYRQGQRADGRL